MHGVIHCVFPVIDTDFGAIQTALQEERLRLRKRCRAEQVLLDPSPAVVTQVKHHPFDCLFLSTCNSGMNLLSHARHIEVSQAQDANTIHNTQGYGGCRQGTS